MEADSEATQRPAVLEDRPDGPPEALRAFTGPERILGILPFVADIGSAPRWHHLLFTEDKILAVPASAEPIDDAEDLFLPHTAAIAERYPSVAAALRLVAIPEPLHPEHVVAIVPYALVRRARLRRGHGPHALPELEVAAGRRTTWWFFQKEDETPDEEKACYARDLLLALLPFPVELVGFSEAPRPPEWHLRHGGRQPLPLLYPADASGPRPPRREDRESPRHG